MNIRWEDMDIDEAERTFSYIEECIGIAEHDAEWLEYIEQSLKIQLDQLTVNEDGTLYCTDEDIKEVEKWLANEYEEGAAYIEEYPEMVKEYQDYVNMIRYESWRW